MDPATVRASHQRYRLWYAAIDFPWRIVEVPPVPITRPVLPQHDPRRRRPQREDREQPGSRKPPPAEGHIIDEYAA